MTLAIVFYHCMDYYIVFYHYYINTLCSIITWITSLHGLLHGQQRLYSVSLIASIRTTLLYLFLRNKLQKMLIA